MSDHTLELASTVVAGMSGSGKTTWQIQYMLNCPAAAYFIYDDFGRFAHRLRFLRLNNGQYLRPVYTARDWDEAIATRWVVFNPARMFPGDRKAAIKYFCQTAYDYSKMGPGKKFLNIDELWQHCTADAVPYELALAAQTGREEGIELLTGTQRPESLNDSILGQCTELVSFRLQKGSDGVKTVARWGMDRDAIENLPLGQWISRNQLTGGLYRGALW